VITDDVRIEQDEREIDELAFTGRAAAAGLGHSEFCAS